MAEVPTLADARRYQLLRLGRHWSVIDGIGEALKGEKLDAAVDAVRRGRAAPAAAPVEPCPYADMCNEEGECTDGCEARKNAAAPVSDWREPHPPSRLCMCPACIPSFDERFAVPGEPVAWQRRHPTLTHGQWIECSRDDFLWWPQQQLQWEARELYAALSSQESRQPAGEVERLAQHVVATARAVADGCEDLDEDFRVPSHLMAPLSLALDEYDTALSQQGGSRHE